MNITKYHSYLLCLLLLIVVYGNAFGQSQSKGQDFQVYTNTGAGYYFLFPLDWKVKNIANQENVIIYPKANEVFTYPGMSKEDYGKIVQKSTFGPKVTINVTRMDQKELLNTNSSVLDECNKLSEFVQGIGYKVNGTSETTLNKGDAKACIIQYEKQGEIYNNPTSIIIIPHFPFIYSITLNAGNSQYFASGNDAFKKILDSFTLY